MIVTINNDMSKDERKKEIEKALSSKRDEQKKKKTENLKKLSGLLSHLKMTPMEIQKEMRDGWNE